MPIAATILLVLGLLGAADIAIFHSAAHGIRRHPDSKGELVLHALRGPTYALLFLAVPNLILFGWYFWVLVGLLVFDLGISIVDFWVERNSRQFLGGLPSGEYVLHVLIAILFGSFTTAVFFEGLRWSKQPTHVVLNPDVVPLWIRVTLALMACLVLVTGFLDAMAAYRLRSQPTRRSTTL